MNKVVAINTAIGKIKSGDKVAVGGFGNVGGFRFSRYSSRQVVARPC